MKPTENVKLEPLKGKTIYTAQALTEESATTNFVSKELHTRLKSCGCRYELFEKKDVKNATAWLKDQIEYSGMLLGIESNKRYALKKLVDNAFSDVIK